jgi:UDP-N-acetylmuramoyl-tripeptide--D-alanyl-D-alanine ligase
MIGFTLAQAAEVTGGKLLGADASFHSVSTDSRTLRDGDLFVALQGPNFDGHAYLSQVAQAGAVGAMVQREIASELPLVQVPETVEGLGQLAAAWRERAGIPLVAVTGSNGKTTVKEMIAAILRQRSLVLATEGNLNNHIGLPLTLLRLQEEEYAVVELGASAAGEIDYLTRIARPDVAVLTNAGRAHLEGFGSLEGVAISKAEIMEGLGPEGVFVLNADDHFAGLWRELASERTTLSFGLRQEADVFSPEREETFRWDHEGFVNCFPVTTPKGELVIELRLAGRHNRANALAAIAAAQAIGASNEEIRQGLASLPPVRGRLQPLQGNGGVRLIDDSYNANPDSVEAAISVLSGLPGRRILVLGELAEMGADEERFYRRLGEEARAAGIDRFCGVGPAGLAADTFGQGGASFESRELLISTLGRELEEGDIVLVKGSRRAGMEQVIQAFAANGEKN